MNDSGQKKPDQSLGYAHLQSSLRIEKLMSLLVERQGWCHARCRTVRLEDPAPEINETGAATGTWHAPAVPEGAAPRTYTDEEVVTLQEAENLMRCRRTKIYLLRRQGVLTTVKRGYEIGLIREEVEHNRQWR